MVQISAVRGMNFGSVAISMNDYPAMLDFRKSLINPTLLSVLKRLH